MSFNFLEYENIQIKQRVNAKMLYLGFLETTRNYNLSFRYKMFWQKHKGGYELLVKQHLKSGKREYLGRRDKNTESLRYNFEKSKANIKERLLSFKNKLKREEKLNKLEGVARVPKELVDIFAKINELGLDDKIIAIGTNSLYAYEAACGVAIEQEHLATHDIDLLNRKNKRVSFIFNEIMTTKNVKELIESIDKSFEQSKNIPYRFINKKGIWVEFINPTSHAVTSKSLKDNVFSDVISLAMNGMEWLENSRLFKELIIADNGKCAIMTTIHPVEYAVHKNWLSKHIRDLEQSKLVTKLILEHMLKIDIKSELDNLKHFKKDVVEAYRKEILLEVSNFRP